MSFVRAIDKNDGPVKKIVFSTPVEVVAFYTAGVNAIMGAQPVLGDTWVLGLVTLAFIGGIIGTILTARNDSSITPLQTLALLISFFLWSWTVGSPMNLLFGPEIIPEAVPGILLFLWSSFMAKFGHSLT